MTRALPDPDASWAWFFDVDGTLVGIAARPDAVRIDRATRDVLRDLYRRAGGAVALLSGRPISDLDRFFPRVRYPAAGQHGAERRGASGRVHAHRPPRGRLDAARRLLAAAVARHPLLVLEDKGQSLALHYRRAPALGGYAHRLARAAARGLGAAYGVQPGKRVVEIRPAGRDKGRAIRDFMREPPFRGRTPVFIGDDRTDEFAFAAVNALDGMSVKVGRGATVARWRLPDVAAVKAYLEHGAPAPRPVRVRTRR